MNEYIANMYTKSICNISYGRFDVRLQVIQSSLAYTEMDQTTYRVSSMSAFVCIIWTLLHIFAYK